MQVFVSCEGQTSGPYSVDQIKDYLDQGILFPHDLAYHEGLENWTALSEIIKVESPAIPIAEPAPIHAEKPPTAIKPKPKQKIVIAVAAVIAILGVCAIFIRTMTIGSRLRHIAEAVISSAFLSDLVLDNIPLLYNLSSS